MEERNLYSLMLVLIHKKIVHVIAISFIPMLVDIYGSRIEDPTVCRGRMPLSLSKLKGVKATMHNIKIPSKRLVSVPSERRRAFVSYWLSYSDTSSSTSRRDFEKLKVANLERTR
jgi:hypothetical protein